MRAWLLAARPKTLAAGLAPVAVGAAMASSVAGVAWLPAAACAVGALLIQIGCNYANVAFDALRGTDDQRVGPTRAVASGLVSPRTMLVAAGLVLTAAFVVGLYLTSLGGWPILALGLISIASAIGYTGGPFPLAYHGLGDLFVFAFFGLLATLGTAWIQVSPDGLDGGLLRMPWWWWAVAAALGLEATAILTVNNIRDTPTDRTAGKRTLPVRLGERGARVYHAALHLAATACLITAALLAGRWSLTIPAGIAALGGAALSVAVFAARGAELNRSLARSAVLELVVAMSVVTVCSLE